MHERCQVASDPSPVPAPPWSFVHGATGRPETPFSPDRLGDDAASASARVLLVDDQIGPADPLVRLLACEGFAIECAATAAEALASASARSYDAIILDLCLPDVPGLVVLARLRARGDDVPILVLTGFGDVQAAYAAGRLGATRFMTKPVFLDLGTALREIITPAANDSALMATRAGQISPDQRVEMLAVATLLERLDGLAPSAPTAREERSGELSESSPDRKRRDLLAVLLRAVADPTLPVPCFAACAKALRGAVGSEPSHSAQATAESTAALVFGALGAPVSDPRVTTSINRLRCAIAARTRLTEHEIARDLGVHPSHVGRILKTETGLSFRNWRAGFAMQVVVRHLIETTEQVAQIAYHRLGYEHASQLDREFHETFGVSPREFRRLWQTVVNDETAGVHVGPR